MSSNVHVSEIFCREGKFDLQLLHVQWKSSISPATMQLYRVSVIFPHLKQKVSLQPEQDMVLSTRSSH